MSDSDTASNSSNDAVADNDLNNPEIITKYRLAADYANLALAEVSAACQPGARIVDLCKLGDAKILEKTSSVYTKPVVVKGEKTKVDKGVAFPTSISVNHVLAAFCPGSDDTTVLREGDIAKIELGAHIDGYVAHVINTIVVGGGPAQGRAADACLAAQNALEASLRLLRPGTKSSEIPRIVKMCGDAYGVQAIEGSVKCGNMKRFVIQGKKEVTIRPTVDEKVEVFEVEEGDVFSMEMSFTTGEDGKTSGKDGICTIYRRAVDVTYMLKLKASRQLFSEIDSSHPSFPFSMREFESKLGATAKLGIKEIYEHQLIHPYPTMVDKEGEFIASFGCTCLVLPSGVLRLTGNSEDYPKCETEKKLDAESEVAKLMGQALKKNKKKANKKKKEGAAEAKK